MGAEPDVALLGRYRLLEELSSTAESRVLKACDNLHAGRLCALKILRLTSSRALEAAQHEFEVLRKLRHPGIAEVYDFGRLSQDDARAFGLVPQANPTPDMAASELGQAGADYAYIASAYYRGLSLREAFLQLFPEGRWQSSLPSATRAASPRPTEDELVSDPWKILLKALAQICEALSVIHARGLIHYDIKPDNLILIPLDEKGSPITGSQGTGSQDQAPAGFESKILDFGLSEAETTPLGARARGTIPYIAPELIAGTRADHRCDLFSLGVSIAYAITGRFPFPGTRPERWISAAQEGQIVDLRKLRPDMPEALASLTESLLNSRPADRPQSALEVVSLLEKTGGFELRRKERPRQRTLPLVGWERELAHIRRELENLKRGEAEKSLVLLVGDSGQFLNELLDEVEILARLEGVATHTGTAFLPRRYPYQPLAEIVQKLPIDLTSPASRHQRFASVLAAFAPTPVPPEAQRRSLKPQLKPRAEAYRFLDLATELFLDAAKDAPLVLCIRDLHLAGRESLELVKSIARNVQLRRPTREASGELEPSRLLIIATCRECAGDPDGALTSPGTDELITELALEPHVERLRLSELGLDRISEWIHERAPQLEIEGEIIRRLHEKTQGLPTLIEEFILRALGDLGESSPPGEALRGHQGPVTPQLLLRLPRSPGEAAFERTQSLTFAQRRLLEILAAAHGPISLRDLAATEDAIREGPGDSDSLSARLERLRNLGFVEVRETASGLEAALSHPELAEQIYRQTHEEARAQIHRTLALVLLEKVGTGGSGRATEDIAFHARMAGLKALFLKQAIEAAEKLCAAHACDAAIPLYEEALEKLGTPGQLSVSGAGSAVETEALRTQVNERLATIYLTRGQHQKAIEKLTFLAAAHNSQADPAGLAAIFRALGEAYQQSGETANAAYFLDKSLKLLSLESTITPTPEASGVADCRTKERLQTLLALGRYHLSRDGLDDAAKAARLALEAAQPQELYCESCCRAHLLLGEVATRRGDHTLALNESHAALELVASEKPQSLLLEVFASLGWSALGLGRYEQALNHFEQGLESSRKLESKFDAASFQSSIGTLHHNRADHQRALDCFTQSLLLSSQVGDLKGIANSYNNLGTVHRLRDNLDRAQDCYKRAIDIFSRINDQQGMATGMSNLASILEHEGKYTEALDYSFRALDKRKKIRSHSGIASSYYRIGKIYQAKGEIEKAITYAEKSLQIRAEVGERLGIAYAKLLLAESGLTQGRYADALQFCEAGLQEFLELDNEVGALLAQEALGRVHLGSGDLDGAQRILEQVLERSGNRQQTNLAGSCRLQLSRIHAHSGDSEKAKRFLDEAEKVFRSLQSQREIAEILLERGGLYLEKDRLHEASACLEEAYAILEELEIRDLVPAYFLLRGRIARSGFPVQDDNAACKFFERGLVEPRGLRLLELEWRLHLEKGRVVAALGDEKLARIHYQEAKQILEDMQRSLPPRFAQCFYALEERLEPQKMLGTIPSHSVVAPPRKLSDTDSVNVAPVLARHVGIDDALRLHHETLKLHQIAAAMGSETDLQKLLENVLLAVVELVDAKRGFVILRGVDKDGGEAESIHVARNFDREEILDPQGKISNSVLREVLKTGKPVLLGNAISEPRYKSSRSVRELRLLSLVCAPLHFRNEVLGLIYLDNRHRRDAFRQEDLSLVQAFADQAAVAVMNARLLEENLKRANSLLEANRRIQASNAQLETAVRERNAELAEAREDIRNRQNQLESRYRFHNIVGKSEAIQEVFALLEKVSATQLPVLLEGESGTGKELIARALHYNGPRRLARFVSLNCGALTESLLESELFGHVRGAFTGAVADQKGLFEIAHEGTLFLDEVGDMSLGMQQKLLRVLQEGEIRRVGGKDNIKVNVRIISASNKRLLDLVAAKIFRQDLYYRIHGIKIHLPSLRERKEDIPILLAHFLDLAKRPGEPERQFDADALRAVVSHDWPGNVRELRHFVERTLLITPGETVRFADLVFDDPPSDVPPPPGGRLPDAGLDHRPDKAPGAPSPGSGSLRTARGEFEREYLTLCLRESGGNVAAAARRSKISRESFYRLLRKHGLLPR